MNTFKIEIRETLSTIVDIEAENLEDALTQIRKKYSEEEIVLDASDFIDVDFIDANSQ